MSNESDNYVKVDFNDIFWNITVEDTGKKNGNKEDSEPIIELKWGWTAGMTEEELKAYLSDDENPKRYNSVKILKSQAMKLRDDLEDVIDLLNAKLFE